MEVQALHSSSETLVGGVLGYQWVSKVQAACLAPSNIPLREVEGHFVWMSFNGSPGCPFSPYQYHPAGETRGSSSCWVDIQDSLLASAGTLEGLVHFVVTKHLLIRLGRVH